MKSAGRVPLPRRIQPMLATLSDKPFDSDDWIFELKMDGIRAVVVKDGSRLDMWTRNEKSLTRRFPTVAAALAELPADSVILDGEIAAFDEQGRSRFSLIQPRIHLTRSKDIAEADEAIPVYFCAFDVLYLNGFDISRFPLIQRKAVLRKLIPNNEGWVRYVDHIDAHGVNFFKAASRHGLEGVVAKLKQSPYRQERSRYWLKIKAEKTDHFVIGGCTPPEGSRKFFGALLLGLYDRAGDLIYVGRTGSGFDDDALAFVHRQLQPLMRSASPFKETPAEVRKSKWTEPQLVCEVKFSDWTPDRKLRAPIFQGLRDDIDPRQCVLEESLPAPESEIRNPKSEIPQTRVELTNLDKVFWPEDGYTKGDLIRYYDRIAPYLTPHLLDRPLVFKRYPNGIHGEYFYQKDAHDYTPSWIRTENIWSPDVERYIRYFIGADREQLIYIANMGAITQNPWSSRLQFIDRPDFVIFDLDPVEASYDIVQKVAIELKAVLDELHLRAYPKTSGASGMHVYLPVLENTFTYEDVRVFAEAVASIVTSRIPEVATIERVVRRRKSGTVYIDFLQNVKGKTVASVYSPRAEIAAPVSTPLLWEELQKPIDPTRYTIRTIFDRLDQHGDLFAPVLTDRQDISSFLNALRARRRK